MFGFLGSLARRLLPIAARGTKNLVKTVVKSDIAKDVGKEMKDLAKDTLISATTNAIEGNPVQSGLDTKLKHARKRIASTIRKSNENSKKRAKSSASKKSRKRKTNFID